MNYILKTWLKMDLTEKFIEKCFPIYRVSEESIREKQIRKGNISTFHTWWARKPIGAARSIILASLINYSTDKSSRKEIYNLLGKISNWEAKTDKKLLSYGLSLIKNEIEEIKLLDPFAGGGSIPLEAVRLGCETYSSDLNPVSVIIQKCLLEFPQKYNLIEKTKSNSFEDLSEAVQHYSKLLFRKIENQIGNLYEVSYAGNKSIGYYFYHLIQCPKSDCKVEIPLSANFWLVNKNDSKIALKPFYIEGSNEVFFKIQKNEEIDFKAEEGTVKRGNVRCLKCNSVVKVTELRKIAQAGGMTEKLVAIMAYNTKEKMRNYFLPKEDDLKKYIEAQNVLNIKLQSSNEEYQLPNAELPPKGTLGFRVQRYGITKWKQLFNPRQTLCLLIFIDETKKLYQKLINEEGEEFAKMITTYMAIILNTLATSLMILCRWRADHESFQKGFDRQAIPMVWNYGEINPFFSVSNTEIYESIIQVIKECSTIQNPAKVFQASALNLPFKDKFFDLIVTDPPYYDAVPYADLSDFFYVWMKICIGSLYPEHFSTPLTPKSQEIIQEPIRHKGNKQKAKEYFETNLTAAFNEANRILKDEGLIAIIFAHKSTEAWETIINSILVSNFVLKSSWPIKTEMISRLRAKGSAALASSIVLVCRKKSSKESGYYNEIYEEIVKNIEKRLSSFWKYGISGADFFISAIGPGIEIFGNYKEIKKISGDKISVSDFLQEIRKIVVNYIKKQLVPGEKITIDFETYYYIIWCWTFGRSKVHFDEARLLGQALGVEVSDLWGKNGFLKKEQEKISVIGPNQRKKIAKLGIRIRNKEPIIIDVLHKACLLWDEQKNEELEEFLLESGHADNNDFWLIAQVISDILPDGDKEKQQLQGLLLRRGKISKTIFKAPSKSNSRQKNKTHVHTLDKYV